MPQISIQSPNRPAVHGHRGARGRMPENSIPAISYAIASGADAAEVDVCVSADDVLVIHHDLHLSSDLTCDANDDRVNPPIAIRDQTLTQLKQFDIGQLDRQSEYAKRFLQQISLPNTSIPTLTDFIERILSDADEKFVFNIELKSAPDNPNLVPQPNRYIDLLLETLLPYINSSNSFCSRLFIQSFDWRLITTLMQRHSGIQCGLLTDQQADGAPRIPVTNVRTLWTDRLDLAKYPSVPQMIASTGAQVWSSNHLDLNQDLVEEAHQAGISVYCWTVNMLEDMERMIAIGVDAITTDYPAELARLLDKNQKV